MITTRSPGTEVTAGTGTVILPRTGIRMVLSVTAEEIPEATGTQAVTVAGVTREEDGVNGWSIQC